MTKTERDMKVLLVTKNNNDNSTPDQNLTFYEHFKRYTGRKCFSINKLTFKIYMLTMLTLAFWSSFLSSCNVLHFSLYVSNSIFKTLFSCCNDSILFWSCSNVAGDGGLSVGPPSIELVSLSSSLALSAIFVVFFQNVIICIFEFKNLTFKILKMFVILIIKLIRTYWRYFKKSIG